MGNPADSERDVSAVEIAEVLSDRHLNANSLARASDDTVWISVSDVTGRVDERFGWLVEVMPQGEPIIHGPLIAYADGVNALAVDSDGTVWLASSEAFPGIWRYREGLLEQVSSDFTGDEGALVVAASEQGVWAVMTSGALLRLSADHSEVIPGPLESPCADYWGTGDVDWSCVSAVAAHPDGALWVGIADWEADRHGETPQTEAVWLLRYTGEGWSPTRRSESPLTGQVTDIAVLPDGTVWVLFDSEEVPAGLDPASWCPGATWVLETSGQRSDHCAGGLARWQDGDWTVVDDGIVHPLSLAVSDVGEVSVVILQFSTRPVSIPAIRRYSNGQITELRLIDGPKHTDEVALVGGSILTFDTEGFPREGLLISSYPYVG